MSRPLALVLLSGALGSLAGCLGLAVEHQRVGSPAPVVDARRLQAGRSTLREALEHLGPPDLLLRAGEVDRAYWISWESDYFKVTLEMGPPILTRNVSFDAFILALGSEELRMARLEFDRAGTLRDLQLGRFESSTAGEYFALDSRVVRGFLEDRERALGLLEADNDEEDVELDARRKSAPRGDPR